jgi:FAD/FMN-containing dehydrogenase
MNKIATYLNEHLLGEVSSSKSVRKKYATDGSVLTLAPEIVAFPRITNDVRKIARFTWQLAEKGHIVGMTARGFGGDVTGAAIGKGIIIDTSVRLNKIIQVAPKDKLVHVQAGASLDTVNEVLRWQGLTLPGALNRDLQSLTVGGVIAGATYGVNGAISDSIERLEVVLANGDVIETGRVNRREVNKKLGLQTFEGEIYRKLEGLLEDNAELIEEIAKDEVRDTTGYQRITEVRANDGSFDLTPLFIGSQGTLGIISEVVLKTDFYSANDTLAVVTADSIQTARDLTERLIELEPAELTVYDGALFRRAAKQGSQFSVLGSVDEVGAVIYIRFGDMSDRAQQHKLKKLRKLLQKIDMGMVDSTERDGEDFRAITGINKTLILGSNDGQLALPIMNGATVPVNRREEFEIALGELAAKHHTELPTELNALNNTYSVYPLLKLETVSDKQKLFKLMADFAAVVDRCGGAFTSDGAEGRLKSTAAWGLLDEPRAALYEQIRQIFDPFGTLNPGVKQKNELRTLVAALRHDYDSASML